MVFDNFIFQRVIMSMNLRLIKFQNFVFLKCLSVVMNITSLSNTTKRSGENESDNVKVRQTSRL